MEVLNTGGKNNPMILIIGLLLLIATQTGTVSADITLQWTYSLQAPIHFSPLITDNKLIASTAQGEVYAFDLLSGKLKWHLDKAQHYWDRSLTVDNERVYVGRSGGFFEAYELATGKQIWSVDLGIDVQLRSVMVDGTLYVPTTFVGAGLSNNPNGKAKLYAIDSKTGHIRWAQTTDNYALQKPAFNGNMLFVAGSYYDPSIEVDEGGLMRVNAYSLKGKALWEYKGLDGFIKSIYADEKAVAYVGYQDFITALDVENGNLLWRSDTGNWTPALSGDQGVIYFGSATTFVYAIASVDGQLLWKFNLAGGSFNYQLGEPVIDDGRLYLLTQKGDIYALNLQTGKQIWMKQTLSDARTGLSVKGRMLATGSIDGNLRLYQLD